jgi:hypothetical protein
MDISVSMVGKHLNRQMSGTLQIERTFGPASATLQQFDWDCSSTNGTVCSDMKLTVKTTAGCQRTTVRSLGR